MISQLAHLKSKKGQTLVEYGLILALVAIVVIVVLSTLGTNISGVFQKVADTLATSS
jgi:pilus assembly protein Flp/PilA